MIRANITVIVDGEDMEIDDYVNELQIGQGVIYSSEKSFNGIMTLVLRDRNDQIQTIDMPSDTTIADLFNEVDNALDND